MPNFAANLTMMYGEHSFSIVLPPLRAMALRQSSIFSLTTIQPIAGGSAQRERPVSSLVQAPPGDWKAGERGITALPDAKLNSARALSARSICAGAQVPAYPRHGRNCGSRGRSRTDARDLCVEPGMGGRLAQKHGIDVLIEPIAQRNMPGFFLNLQEEGHAIAAETACTNLKILMDLFHCQVAEGDLAMKYASISRI